MASYPEHPCTPDDLRKTYNRVLQKCCHCYHPFYRNHHEQGNPEGGGSTFFYVRKRPAATTFTSFLSQNEEKKENKQEAENDHTPGKGREYRHTEPENRTDKTEPAGGQGADRSLTET
ncbi:hypothetical protein [Phocaeicola sartorii]|uniref:Uncharacterized protein n=2 Tax=Phocaeicola sartorii TaxID=671267 RepID=R9HYM0_9BACT|nr:hypothetical protein [Phocaeicola sartorii]EOS09054.1 hypothetical protein C802_04046 [Phocaeicola sartorii]MCR1846104.1 hypothetical protein [Phocaeicola sartorii]